MAHAASDARGPTSCVRLDDWLRGLARLPPRHILVILDCCGSGIALAPRYRRGGQTVMSTRAHGADMDALAPLRMLRSRRVITSALDAQAAIDVGPRPGHSLFTGCLVNAIAGELFTQVRRSAVASSELFHHVRADMWRHSQLQQTPDFGALPCDERGELILEQPTSSHAPHRSPTSASRIGSEVVRLGLEDFRTPRTPVVVSPSATAAQDHAAPRVDAARRLARDALGRVGAASLDRDPRPAQLDARFAAALDRHEAERAGGRAVLSVVAAEPAIGLAGWATWAARRGWLTLPTAALTADLAVAELLAAMPWLRLVRRARAQLAQLIGVATLDRALAAPDPAPCLDKIAGGDPVAQVCAWLVAWSIAPWGCVPDLEQAPVRGAALLAAACQLAPPIAVTVQPPDAADLDVAQRVALALQTVMPRVALAVVAPTARLRDVRDEHRRSVVPLTHAPHGGASMQAIAARACASLAADPRTAGSLECDVPVPVHGSQPSVTADLLANDALLAILIDGWYRDAERERHRVDRVRDAQLQHASYYVLRVPADAIAHRPGAFIDEVASILAGRHL